MKGRSKKLVWGGGERAVKWRDICVCGQVREFG